MIMPLKNTQAVFHALRMIRQIGRIRPIRFPSSRLRVSLRASKSRDLPHDVVDDARRFARIGGVMVEDDREVSGTAVGAGDETAQGVDAVDRAGLAVKARAEL